MSRTSLVTRTFVELADTLVDDFDVVDLLSLLADRCVDALDVAAAGIVLAGDGGELRVVASSSHAMHLLELLEVQAQEGPCLDCFRTGRPVVDVALATSAGRWPQFAPAAVAAGFGATQALPLRLRGKVLGALNLFHAAAEGIPAADLEIAQAFADVAAIAILQQRVASEAQVLNGQLQHALTSRIVIEQAKGMVAEREGIEVAQAFDLLRSHARSRNVRLADLAHDLVTGAVPPADLRRPPPPG